MLTECGHSQASSYAWEKSACHAEVQSNGADFLKISKFPEILGELSTHQRCVPGFFFSAHASLGTRLILCTIMILNVVSLSSTCYSVNMCIHLQSGGKLLFTASYSMYDHDLKYGFSFLHLLLCERVHSLMLSL